MNMNDKTSALSKFVRDEQGASFIEYIIVVGLVAIFAIVAFQNFGQAAVDKLKEETDNLNSIQVSGG